MSESSESEEERYCINCCKELCDHEGEYCGKCYLTLCEICLRCEGTPYEDLYKICMECGKQTTGNCCLVWTGCQTNDCVCVNCIMVIEDFSVECEKCGKDMREEMSTYTTKYIVGDDWGCLCNDCE